MTNNTLPASLLRMAGIAGIMAFLLIIIFATTAESNHLFFFNEIYEGGSPLSWINDIKESPLLSKVIMALPVLAFSCFLITGSIIYQWLPSKSWQKNLSLIGYVIGVPVAIIMWILQLSLMNHILLTSNQLPESEISGLTSFILFFFHVMNEYFIPFFIIVMGSGLLYWAALKDRVFPAWLCYVGMIISFLMFISFLSLVQPAIRPLSNIAPLHMLWFAVLGIYLLKASFKQAAQ